MRTLLTIFCAGCLWLAVFTTPSTAQVPYDLSKAVQYKTVWIMEPGVQTAEFSFNTDFGGRQGLDIITTGFYGERRHQTWATRPKLDTTNLFNWNGVNNAVYLKPIDYDGVPPYEYANAMGIIWRCAEGSSPFPLTPIDTACAGEPEWSVDIDGDGYLDAITDIGGDLKTARVIMGGPQAGKGCERVFPIPLVHNRKLSVWNAAFYRSSTGIWRTIQIERDAGSYSTWLMIYDVTIARVEGTLKATFTKRDSIEGIGRTFDEGTFGSAVVVIDTNARKDWLLVMHKLRVAPGKLATERFDVTDGRLGVTGEQITGYEFLTMFTHNLGHQLGTTKPVIAIASSDGYLFCYGDNIRQPFAKADFGADDGWVVINDQTGDGKPDILVSNTSIPNGRIRLLSPVPTNTSVPQATGSEVKPVQLRGEVLEVTLTTPIMVSAQMIMMDGRTASILAPVQGLAGVNRYDLSNALRRFASGTYHLRVYVGETSFTIPILR